MQVVMNAVVVIRKESKNHGAQSQYELLMTPILCDFLW